MNTDNTFENTNYVLVGSWARIGVRILDSLLISVGVLLFSVVVYVAIANSEINKFEPEYATAIAERIELMSGSTPSSARILDIVFDPETYNCNNLFTGSELQDCKNYLQDSNRTNLIITTIGTVITLGYFVLLPITKLKGHLIKRAFKFEIISNLDTSKTTGEYNPISFGQSMLREIFNIFNSLASLAILVLVYFGVLSQINYYSIIIGLIFLVIFMADTLTMFISKNNQSIHDMIAKTKVVKNINSNEF